MSEERMLLAKAGLRQFYDGKIMEAKKCTIMMCCV